MLLRRIHTAHVSNLGMVSNASRQDAQGIAQDVDGGYITGQDLGEYRLADLVDVDALHVVRDHNLVVAWQETVIHIFEIID